MTPNRRLHSTDGNQRPDRKNPPEHPPAERPEVDEHEGATDEQVGDTTGPGVGYDQEPEHERDKGGVIPS